MAFNCSHDSRENSVFPDFPCYVYPPSGTNTLEIDPDVTAITASGLSGPVWCSHQPKGTPMIRIAVIAAAFLSIGAANAETRSPARDAAQVAATPSSPLVRNIGIAEMGDAIVVRERAAATRSEQK